MCRSEQNHAGPLGFDKGFCMYPKSNGTPLNGSDVIIFSSRKDCWLSVEACNVWAEQSGELLTVVWWGSTGSLGWGHGGEAERSECVCVCVCSLCVCLEEGTLTHVGDVLGLEGEAEGNG